MTKRQPWPNAAKWARDESIEALAEGIRALTPLVLDGVTATKTEQLRRSAIALTSMQEALLKLEKTKQWDKKS